MAKIIHTVATEDGKIESTDDIFAFTTKNYIGVWNKNMQEYNIMRKETNSYFYSDCLFNMKDEDEGSTLTEFYERVFAVTHEELEEVYDTHTKINITIEEEM